MFSFWSLFYSCFESSPRNIKSNGTAFLNRIFLLLYDNIADALESSDQECWLLFILWFHTIRKPFKLYKIYIMWGKVIILLIVFIEYIIIGFPRFGPVLTLLHNSWTIKQNLYFIFQMTLKHSEYFLTSVT